MAQEATDADPAAASEPTRSDKTFDLWSAERLTGDWGGVRSRLEEAGLQFKLYYQSQYQQNFRGGLQTHHGHRFSGTYDVELYFDLEKLTGLSGATAHIKAKGNYSDGINPNKVGALNNTNADAVGDLPVYVRKWWYQQELWDDKVELLIGRLTSRKNIADVGVYAFHEDYDFLNTSSGQNATIPHCNGIGAVLTVRPEQWLYFLSGTLDGQAERTQTGFDTAFHEDPKYIGYWELGFTPQWETTRGPMPGKYRIGWWYDARPGQTFSSGRTRSGDMGIYLGLDQLIYKENESPKDSQGLGVFARYGHRSRDIHEVSDYWQIGASYEGLLATRDADVTAVSVSQSILSPEYRKYVDERADRETVYEWYYRWKIAPCVHASPNLQIITRPGGTKDDRNALVGGLRIQVIF